MVKKKSSCGSTSSTSSHKKVTQIMAILFCALINIARADSLADFMTSYRTIESSNNQFAGSEGLILEASPSYIDFKGDDGLKLEVSLPATSNFDYTIMFWFRCNKSYKELGYDDSIANL